MFKKSPKTKQFDMFSSPSGLLCERAGRLYDDPSAWHNTFYRDVTSNIDKEIFKPLYTTEKDDNRVGRPNVSIRILVAMIILKEGIGYSDEQLYEHCRFNLLYRRALGMVSLDEQCPTINPDAEYRGKNKQRVKGFVTNITETIPENGKPNLITDVKVKGATVADNDFFEEAVKETEKVTGDDVENTYVDGAYQSEKNREFAKDKINIISGGLQGKPSRFDLNLKDDQTLEVTDKTRYRTLFKHGLQAIARCAWINMRRLFCFDNN